jgi:hypothetical protein
MLSAAGCGPIYATDYQFQPPQNETVRVCVLQCQLLRGQCQQIQALEQERCEDRADRDYYWCQRNRRYATDSEGRTRCVANCTCTRAYCGRSDHACDPNYRECYTGCGGIVAEQRKCVFNCQGAQ